MLIYRSRLIVRSPLGFVSLSVLLFAAFLIPYRPGTAWFIDPLIVILYFPVIVALGAGARLSGVVAKICHWSGELSYPLYMVHFPFIWFYWSWIEKYKPTMNQMVIVTIAGTIALILFAYLVNRFLDLPVRTYFRKKVRRSVS